ncbi:MAG: hypothetical protein ACFFD2_09365 [Promethearchaeota archaeon]
MNKSEIDPEERKITIESKATVFFILFILIEGYILISNGLGVYPYSIDEITLFVVLESPAGLYILYWIGIFCLILGLLVGNYNKIFPPIVLIASIIFFIAFIFES